MYYLNNAATSFPKPPCVAAAVQASLQSPPHGGRRGSLGAAGADELQHCREVLAVLLGVRDAQRIFFTGGATEAFNLVVRGLPLAGRSVVVSATEHNALLRPLYALLPRESICVVPCGPDGTVAPEAIAAACAPGTACVMLNHMSNVTGAVQDMRAAGRIAREKGAWFVVDASQSAGVEAVDVESMQADVLVFTGHKNLFGPAGTGGFYLRGGVPMKPAKFGGTGTEGDSALPQGEALFEVGTQNLPGLAGLAAGAGFVLEAGVDAIGRHVAETARRVRTALAALPGVAVYGNSPAQRGGVVSFNIGGLAPADAAYILQHAYHIEVRAGHHCAPFMARALGAPQGSVRASFSYLTPNEDIDAFLGAVQEMAEGAGEGAQ